jgi:hypothetical protein
MSKKFSAQRKRAFLTYLSQTGNQTLSAERAKVSRSWVRLHRSGDPEFDAACRSAVAEAKAALEALASPPLPARAPHESPSPAKGGGKSKWRYFEGHELVVRGTGGAGGGKRVQIGRAREKQWTPRAEKRFLSALGATCNVKAACAEVGMWPPSAYNHRDRWPAFAERWAQAEKIGFFRIQAAMAENGCNLFSDPEVEPDLTLRGMTIADAMEALRMHKHSVLGLGKRPGLPPRVASGAEIVEALKKRLKSFEAPQERKRRSGGAAGN